MSESFGRNRRLTRRAEFRRAYSEGRAYATPLFVCHVVASENRGGPSRLGLSASKRTGLAHDRNRYRRWAREVFRRTPLCGGQDVVVTFRQAIAAAEFEKVRSALLGVFARAHLMERSSSE